MITKTSCVFQVKFLYNCSEGQKCNTDLQLTGNLIHENSESVQLYNIVNQTKKVVIHLSVYNSRDTAFSIILTVNVTGQIEFLSSSSMNTSHHVQCEHQAKFSSGYQLLCPIWMTVHTNVTLAVTLYFQADTVPAERENRYVTFDIIALPNIGEDEVNLTDNSIKLVSEIKISANLSVNGWGDFMFSSLRYFYISIKFMFISFILFVYFKKIKSFILKLLY